MVSSLCLFNFLYSLAFCLLHSHTQANYLARLLNHLITFSSFILSRTLRYNFVWTLAKRSPGNEVVKSLAGQKTLSTKLLALCSPPLREKKWKCSWTVKPNWPFTLQYQYRSTYLPDELSLYSYVKLFSRTKMLSFTVVNDAAL